MSSVVSTQVVNFRKLKQDFASQPLREGKELFQKKAIKSAKVVQFSPKVIKVHGEVTGSWGNVYTCEVEFDRLESCIVDSSCDCPHTSDCQHLVALVLHLEEELEKLILGFTQEKKKAAPTADAPVDKVVAAIEKKVEVKQKKENEKMRLDEYTSASHILGHSAFFVPDEELNRDGGEIAFVLIPHATGGLKSVEVQPVLRLQFRSKPFYIQQPKQFFAALQTQEPIVLGGRRFIFSTDSFGPFTEALVKTMRPHLTFTESKTEKGIMRTAELDREGLGELLAVASDFADKNKECKKAQEKCFYSLPGLFWCSQEKPLLFSETKAEFLFEIEHFTEPTSQLMLMPRLNLGDKRGVDLKSVMLFECSRPGALTDGQYFRFQPEIKRQHVHELESIQKMTIPEPLFGSFVENGMAELSRFAKIKNKEILEPIVTYPLAEPLRAVCDLNYASGELEAQLQFNYGKMAVPESTLELTTKHMDNFVSKSGILARNLVEENALVRDLFSGFIKDDKTGAYVAKTDKKIVEFMTEVIPKEQHRVEFHCPESLEKQFCYDETRFTISLSESTRFDQMKLELSIDGQLSGISVDYLWDCVASRRTYVVIQKKGTHNTLKEDQENELLSAQKILVLKLDDLSKTLQLFDELDIKRLENMQIDIPLWALVNLIPARFEDSLITLKMTNRLKAIQEQIFDMQKCKVPPMPASMQANFRPYQVEGIEWLAKLRLMGLNGILADDMGLGKTLQAITAVSQYIANRKETEEEPPLSLVVCPTSLVDNWKEEFFKFQPNLRVATCSGTPQERKKIINNHKKYDVLVTSYGLVQKDIELYEQIPLGYLILDEAQYIKNRETRNARSVKKIPARHKLILTGTPLENSLDDLWSLFDFLMPGILGSFDRFVNSYIRPAANSVQEALQHLRRKVTPFVLRRMKVDVLKDLPPISHLVYNCRLSPVQQELYSSYAKSAREQLTKLVEKEGFDKVRLQVLATLTRLKQICCHPAIFAKESAESGDSAKYEMLLDLLSGLIESKHKTVVFSQYTQMLSIMKNDLERMGIPFAYLDGSSKNRLDIVKRFNEDPNCPLFLVSLKVGGTGLNLVGADTVIHYDMWWNPAVENQATDRVWRMGQKQSVSSYKLVTLGTIEEKIVALQNRKKELLKDIVRSDEEVISKLTWDEVLELLKS